MGDARLNRRLLALAETFGAHPTAPINQASDDWYATKAAYGFFANPKALPAELLAPHQERTLQRMQAHNLVLLAQDTTFLNYTHHPATSGLGSIGGGQRGLVMHSTLALTPQLLMSGVYFPVEQMPVWLQAVANALPLKHAIDIARPLMLGNVPEAILLHVAVLVAYAFVAYWVALVLTRRRLLK